ncbi:MAG: type II secretion system F family protein [Aliivibrio sp.]|uniref:type II secretion system F family protein n=1 Tax=Aliivibrio sp. TaxID=1872443 RepID=UPI001A43E300|nr:type II secretion system F family protein [Aliivibrio sp.]
MLTLLLGIGICALLFIWFRKPKRIDYMEVMNQTQFVDSMQTDRQAIDLSYFKQQSIKKRALKFWAKIQRQVGNFAFLKILFFLLVSTILGQFLNLQFLRAPAIYTLPVTLVLAIVFGIKWLNKREKTRFEESFPDALNILTSAVSAGESLMHAIIYVGNSLEGEVGKEFKKMGSRLQVGESAEMVFRKSCDRFPYPSFHFFVITLTANIRRGGQLKDVMGRLNRLMFDARSIEKKKYALTSEARMSAKIVASLPFIFIIMLKFLSPENYEFVMFDPAGKPILYYVMGSEFIGISIVWSLMNGVK